MRTVLPWFGGLFLCVHAATALSEAPVAERGYAFCTVTDTGSTPAKVWASPVMAVEYPGDDPAGFRRSLDLASEFLEAVQARGGQGAKNCNVTATLQEAAQLRAEAEAIWNKRTFMIKIGDWREVAWTPKPWAPTAAPASTTRYFLCSAMQTDLPDRIAISRSVASGIITREVPGARALEATFELNQAFSREFQAVVQAHGLPVQGSCSPYDSLAEAQYALQQQRKLMDGFNQKYTEVAWEPSASATELAQAEAHAPAPVFTQFVTPATSPLAATPTPAASDRFYCVAGISRSKPVENLETPVHEVAGNPADTAAMSTLLADLLASLASTSPGWEPFPAPTCYPNDTMFAGESFCFASAMKRLKGLSQTAALFCNTSREGIDARVKDMHSIAAGVPAQLLAWPE